MAHRATIYVDRMTGEADGPLGIEVTIEYDQKTARLQLEASGPLSDREPVPDLIRQEFRRIVDAVRETELSQSGLAIIGRHQRK